ncbi:MAG: amino acid transporter [archaeon]|nr:amino acid transporter [archaeon]
MSNEQKEIELTSNEKKIIEEMETDDYIPTDKENAEEYKNFISESEDNDGENRNLSEDKKVPPFGISITIIKAIIGVGIINIPFIYKTLGLILGTSVLILTMFISISSVAFLMKCKDYTQRYSYATYAKITYKTTGAVILKLIVISKTLCSCCVRLRAFGNVSQSMVTTFIKDDPDNFFLQKNFYVLLIFFILMPLMFMNDISGLKRFSFLGVVSVFVFVGSLVIVCIYKYLHNELIPFDSGMLWPTVGVVQIFKSITAFFDTFSFHINTFPIYLTMKQRSTKKMISSTTKAILTTGGLYIVTGLSGFIMYRDKLQKDVFQNFKNDVIYYKEKNIFISMLLFISLIAFFISALLSMPLVFFSLKKNLTSFILFLKKKAFGNKKETEPNENLVTKQPKKESITGIKKHLLTLFCYCMVCICTLCVETIMTLNSLAGSTFGNFINMFAPAFFLLCFSKATSCSLEKNWARSILMVSIATIIWFISVQVYEKLIMK